MEQNPTIDCKKTSMYDLKRAYYSRTPIAGIEFILTHVGPHNDELFSGYILQKTPHGKHLFPGIENAKFGLTTQTSLLKKKWLGKEGFFEALGCGILLVGIGGGPLDEHGDRANKISCTALVVNLIGLTKEKYDRKIYGPLIHYINFEDCNGDNSIQCLNRIREEGGSKLSQPETDVLRTLQIGSLAQNLKKGFEVAGDDMKKYEENMRMAYTFYTNEVEHTKMFVNAERAYDVASKKIMDINIPTKEDSFVLIEMQSDAPDINKVAQSKWAANKTKKLGILFLHKSNGQFVLMPNHQHISATQMREVVKIIRQTVAHNKDIARQIGFSELGKDGVIDLIPDIYFDEARGIIANGSKVDPDVPGLIGKSLSIQEVIESIQIGLDTDFFPQKFIKGCKAGNCAKGLCWMYRLSQERCHQVRAQHQGAIGQALNKSNME